MTVEFKWKFYEVYIKWEKINEVILVGSLLKLRRFWYPTTILNCNKKGVIWNLWRNDVGNALYESRTFL